MKLENAVCSRVHEHHEVLKGELGRVLLEVLSQARLDRSAIEKAIATVNATVDTGSSKMTTDYQRFFANVK